MPGIPSSTFTTWHIGIRHIKTHQDASNRHDHQQLSRAPTSSSGSSRASKATSGLAAATPACQLSSSSALAPPPPPPETRARSSVPRGSAEAIASSVPSSAWRAAMLGAGGGAIDAAAWGRPRHACARMQGAFGQAGAPQDITHSSRSCENLEPRQGASTAPARARASPGDTPARFSIKTALGRSNTLERTSDPTCSDQTRAAPRSAAVQSCIRHRWSGARNSDNPAAGPERQRTCSAASRSKPMGGVRPARAARRPELASPRSSRGASSAPGLK